MTRGLIVLCSVLFLAAPMALALELKWSLDLTSRRVISP